MGYRASTIWICLWMKVVLTDSQPWRFFSFCRLRDWHPPPIVSEMDKPLSSLFVQRGPTKTSKKRIFLRLHLFKFPREARWSSCKAALIFVINFGLNLGRCYTHTHPPTHSHTQNFEISERCVKLDHLISFITEYYLQIIHSLCFLTECKFNSNTDQLAQ